MIKTKLYPCGDTPADFEDACYALAEDWHSLQVKNFDAILFAYCRLSKDEDPGYIYVAERRLEPGDKRLGGKFGRFMSLDWDRRKAASFIQAWASHEPVLADRYVTD